MLISKTISIYPAGIRNTKMPASSRKRNKGKDRKAKKAAEKEVAKRVEAKNTWYNWARGNMSGAVFIECNHGFGEVLPEESHPVSSFITTFCVNTLKDAFLLHPEVGRDGSPLKMVIDILTKVGANLLYAGIREEKTLIKVINSSLISPLPLLYLKITTRNSTLIQIQ